MTVPRCRCHQARAHHGVWGGGIKAEAEEEEEKKKEEEER